MNFERIVAWVERVRRDRAVVVEARLHADRIRVWTVDGLSDGDIAAEALSAIEEDAAGQPEQALLAYRLMALRPDEREPFARLMVPVARPAAAPAGQGANAFSFQILHEHAREQGMLLRDLVRMHIESRAGDNGVLLEHNRQLTKQVEEYEHRRLGLYQAHEEALSQKQLREVQGRMATLEEKKHAYFAERLDMLAPIVINRFLGGGRGNGAPGANEMFRSLLGSMTPDQIDALQGGQPFAWSPEQSMLIGELYMSFAKAEEARKRRLNVVDGAPEGVSVQLDANLPEPLVARVLTALGSEREPAALEKLAAEIEREYPLSATALKNRAKQLRERAGAAGSAT